MVSGRELQSKQRRRSLFEKRSAGRSLSPTLWKLTLASASGHEWWDGSIGRLGSSYSSQALGGQGEQVQKTLRHLALEQWRWEVDRVNEFERSVILVPLLSMFLEPVCFHCCGFIWFLTWHNSALSLVESLNYDMQTRKRQCTSQQCDLELSGLCYRSQYLVSVTVLYFFVFPWTIHTFFLSELACASIRVCLWVLKHRTFGWWRNLKRSLPAWDHCVAIDRFNLRTSPLRFNESCYFHEETCFCELKGLWKPGQSCIRDLEWQK